MSLGGPALRNSRFTPKISRPHPQNHVRQTDTSTPTPNGCSQSCPVSSRKRPPLHYLDYRGRRPHHDLCHLDQRFWCIVRECAQDDNELGSFLAHRSSEGQGVGPASWAD